MIISRTLMPLVAALLASLSLTAQARNDAPPAGCGSWDKIPTKFIEGCALAGADTYIICTANGDVMCCKNKAGGGRDCSTNPGDLTRRTPGGVNTAPPPANKLPEAPIRRPPLPTTEKAPGQNKR